MTHIVEPSKPIDPSKPPPASSGILSRDNGSGVLPENSWAEAMKQFSCNDGTIRDELGEALMRRAAEAQERMCAQAEEWMRAQANEALRRAIDDLI